MHYGYDLLISVLLIVMIVIFWLIKFKAITKHNIYILILISIISIIFGFNVWINNGLILDYGTPEEANSKYAFHMLTVGLFTMLSGIISLGLTIIMAIRKRFNRKGK